MLSISLRLGETVRIGDALVVLTHKGRDVCTVVIDADPSVPVVRSGTSVPDGGGKFDAERLRLQSALCRSVLLTSGDDPVLAPQLAARLAYLEERLKREEPVHV